MQEENTCLICLEENMDMMLTCCNQKIHGSCVRQWWARNNIPMDEATCPHCRQLAKLERISIDNPVIENNPIIESSPVIENNVPIIPPQSIYSSRVYPIENNLENVIVPNINFNLTDQEIRLINSNVSNRIPINPFSHYNDLEIEEETVFVSTNKLKVICSVICMIIIIVTCVFLLV